MAVHLIHIGKTGGTALKYVLRPLSKKGFDTPFGTVTVHSGHRFKLADVPRGDYAIIFLRDPISLYLSAFDSRLRKGQPRFYFEWTPGEARAFERFPTPEALAHGLYSKDDDERKQARQAMRDIRHLRGIRRAVGSTAELVQRHKQIAYLGRTETLDEDFPRLKEVLQLPADARGLAKGKRAHRRPDSDAPPQLDKAAQAALRRWYRQDYEILRVGEMLREAKGWTGAPPQPRLSRELARRRYANTARRLLSR